ncbi:G-patch domain-containing protein [Entamoeba marina]
MDLTDDVYSIFVKQLEETGWKVGKGLGKNEDGITKVDIKTKNEKLGIGAKIGDTSRLDDVYAGKCKDLNDVEFVSSTDSFDKFDSKNQKKPKSVNDSDDKKKKLNSVDAVDVALQFGRGRRQRGKLMRIKEQELKYEKC